MPGSYVSEDLRNREEDIVWRVKWKQDWIYIYLLLEFQSSVDEFMAVRMMAYLSLLYQDLIKRDDLEQELLPPVLPVVLYNGNAEWQAATDINTLIYPAPQGLDTYRPQMRYLLLDEKRYNDSELAPLKNLVAALFRLENSRTPDDILQVVSHLIEWLAAPEQATLRRAFTVWLNKVVLRQRLPNGNILSINSLQESERMSLAETIDSWIEEAEKKGIKKGLEQGIERGLEQGIERGLEQGYTGLLLKQLELKFGTLSIQTIEKVKKLSQKQIMLCAERVLTAKSLDEVFKSMNNVQ